MLLLQCPDTGERCLVESADGYAGWAVLADNLNPPHDYFRWDADAQEFIEDLSELQAALLAKIDREAGEFRSQFITAIPGQETTYRLKEDEARAWVEGESDPADFPYLREEAAAKGVMVASLAAFVLTVAGQWRALNPKIEAARTASKDAVTAASTKAGKEAASAVNWGALL